MSEIPAEDLLSREHVDRSNRTPEELAVLSNELLVDWEFGDSERDAFLDTVAELQGSGIETVVVLMPVPSENVEAHPGGRAEFESFRAEVLALGSEHGFIVLDYSRDFSDTSFMDYTHLRPDSAATFSATLANDLAELGW